MQYQGARSEHRIQHNHSMYRLHYIGICYSFHKIPMEITYGRGSQRLRVNKEAYEMNEQCLHMC